MGVEVSLMRVKEAMKTAVRTISPSKPLSEAQELMKRYGIDHLVVVERGVPAGLLSDGDVLRHHAEGTVRDAMSRDLITIDSDELLQRAANLMRGHEIKCLVVTKEGKLAGVLTSSDLLEVFARSGHRERMILRDRGPRKGNART